MDLGDRLARLSPQRRALLARRLGEGPPSATPAPRIPPQPRDGRSFPLSFAQDRLWFEQRLEPEAPAYHEAVVLEVRGPLRLDWVEAALNDRVRCNESLRSAIVETEGAARQVILDACDIRLERADMSGRPRAEIDAAVRAAILRPFGLDTPPLLRLAAYRLSADAQILVFVVHHIVLDGWSAAALFRGIFADYEARQRGEPAPDNAAPTQYADFAVWERRQVEAGERDGALAFWMRHLGDAPPPPALPFDRPRSATRGAAGARLVSPCGLPLSAALRGLARRQETTIFTLLAAVFGLLLWRISDETDVVFSAPSTTRDLPELESAVGLFINTIVLRFAVEADRSFADYLADVRGRVAEAQAHRLYPYDKLVAQLRRDRDGGGMPATAVMFDVQRLPSGIAPDGLAVDYLDVDPGTSKFDLGLSIKDDGDVLVGTFEYATELFDRATVESLAGAFKALLAGVAAHPDRPLRDLGLLSPEEARREIARGLGAVRDYGAPVTIQAAFDALAERLPDRLAVTSGGDALRYGALARAANRLAHRLIALKVGPGQPVAVALDRSVTLIVGILAILKAGGAYVPLDPAWPPGRRADILGESGARVIVAAAGFAVPPDVVLCDPLAAGDEIETAPDVPVRPESLAYVIYTSGSTGRPRGVTVTHAAVLNLFHALRETVYGPLGVGPVRVAMNGPAAFDTSVKHFVQLLAGHTLDVVPDAVRADPAALVGYIRSRGIDVLDVTPTHLAMLLAAGLTAPGGPSPRMVLVGGEAIDPVLWARLADCPTTRFVNLYGPTECTVDATVADVTGPSPTIGRPLPNVRTYVLDGAGRPVPGGLPGELCIGGAGVSPGYLGDPHRTAERFVSLPFDASPVYRTGDVVRRRHDGHLAFLRRADGQLKLRGHRVEPGEVAAALKQVDGVVDAAVLGEGDGAQRHLVGYVVASPARAPQAGGEPRHILPNGLAVVQVNRNETDFLYEEMFERNAYGRHGIALRPGDVVFDVGANIGLFSLWAHHAAPGVRVHAFEPNPAVFACLETNLALYGVEARTYPVGLAAAPGRGDFTAYPGFTILSGLHADPAAESEIVRSFVRRHQQGPGTFDAAGLDELIGDRLGTRPIPVELDTLSAAMARAGIGRIDLLKINVEKSEAEVLAGVSATDWPRIRQVALEVHDIAGRLGRVTGLLEAQGFTVAVEQDWRLEANAATNFYVYARRGEREGPAPVPSPIAPIVTPDALHRALAARLPDYMVPAAFVVLDALPMTPSGKLDRARLPGPVAVPDGGSARTPTETRLAAVWCAVLGRDPVGRHDDFFRIGGHSLLATLLMARVRAELGIALPLRALFEAPTIARLAARIDREAPAAGAPVGALPSIEPDPAAWHEPFPLTPIQQAYWMGRNAAFELGAAATQIYLELEEVGWDVRRVEAAWNRLIQRHDMLRAVILSEAAQRILPDVPYYVIATDDLRGLPAEEVARRLAARRHAMAGQTIEPDRWPLFTVKASLLDGARVRLHVGVDALIADAASLFLLFDEWRRGYEAEDPGPRPAIGFRDYVLAERSLEDGALHRIARDYWFGRLDTLPPAPDLPVDRSLAARSRPEFRRRSRRLAPALWDALKARAAEAGLTPSLVLIAAFAEILGRWSADPRFTLNLTTFNRLPLHPDVTKLMGDFTTLTLLEVDHTAPATFEERARSLQARLWDDLEHGTISGIAVLRALAQRRRSGASALMPVVFTSALDIDPAGRTARRFGEVVESVSQTPQVWLDHQVMEWNGELVLNWDAVEAIFPDGFLDDLAAAHGALVERLATSPEAWTGRLGALLPPWQAAQRVALNDTEEAFGPERLEQPFLRHARRDPAAPAILCSGRTLAYGELADRAQEIAALLQAEGRGPGHLVAVVMRKGWEQIAAALGILMAGAAYLPVDPDLPDERRSYILKHCDVVVALTQSGVADAIAWPEGIARVVVDRLPGTSGGLRPAPPTGVDDLAYVLFTSGSTGVPKGVMIAHRAITNTITDFARRYRLSPGDRTLALSALSFDLSVFDIFGALSAGGAVVMPDPGRVRDPDHLADLARRHGVTVWQSVPALMLMMVEAMEARPRDWPGSLRCIIMSGDWIPVPLPDRIRALSPDIEIHGQGGATETSINAVVYPIGAVDPAWRSIPYGRPFANQTAHILDRDLEPVPVWVPGELYIGGIGLADGYWKDRDRTDAAFIRHPRTGERLYRTGDYGRVLPDGNIEFLGRRDNQVKINGYRIELGEIEAALSRHPDIGSAIAAAPADAAGRRTLLAYVVRRDGEADVGADLGTEGVLLDPVERLAFKLDRRGLRVVDADASAVPLPGGAFDAARETLWLRRQSIRQFVSETIPMVRLGAWLGVLQPMPVEGSPLPKRRYPSAGSLYPVQVYLMVKPGAVEGLAGGAYYYEPVLHRLVAVGPNGDGTALYPRANRGLVQSAGVLVVLVGKRAAVEPLYGPLWRDFCLLEAGTLSQLLAEAAGPASLGLCALGFLDEARARTMLGLEGADIVLHSLAGGAIAPAQITTWSPGEAVPDDTTPEALRAWLGRRLPAYMVPSRFILLDRLPQTANGKIDREALPRPEAAQTAERGGLPASDLEKAVAAAVETVLSQGGLGLDANFFDLGANSMHLIQLHRRLQADLARPFPLVDIFQNPSIRRLAAYLGGEAEVLPTDDIRDRADRSRTERSQRLARRRDGRSPSNAPDHAR